ncbi:MAG: UDP-N-acetylglucosamine 4,6-dehydratase (inverting) [Candidatus Omnitrophica bacterium]|nr:UDP-N-acetylglucosamine 4,6-dehydratase (inverting) [Candidatus Omnitrophota bacterium]
MFDELKGSTVLITGGTGSFGRKCTEILLKKGKLRKLIIFSRDELKQFEMSQVFNSSLFDCKISYYLGDVRDAQRLHRAFHGVDFVIHAAALKQVPSAEYNPCEAVKTNVMGAVNIIDAAIDQKVKKVIALSTDKAVSPVNLYGATKLCSEKLFVAGNSYVGEADTRFSVVRYGNVIGSRGSVIPFFLEKKKTGVLPITDEKMTRFWMTLEDGVMFVLNSLKEMAGGEVFVPRIPSMKIVDLAKAIAPDCTLKHVGIRPGEKLHECLMTEDETRHARRFEDHFVIIPECPWWKSDKWDTGEKLEDRFKYSSDSNDQWLSEKGLLKIIAEFIK